MLSDYLLPVTGGYLRPCTVPEAALTPVSGGHHCGSCQRTVHDLRNASAAEVAQVRAASPDGRLCGRFRVEHPAPAGFSRRLRWFVVALVLVVGQGPTAQEALAQIQQEVKPSSREWLGMYVEQMPELRGGGGMAAIVREVQKHFSYSPAKGQKPSGKVYVSFVVSGKGKVEDVRVIKGSTALIDTAAVRAVQMLPIFIPGQQMGKPISISITVPISYVKPE